MIVTYIIKFSIKYKRNLFILLVLVVYKTIVYMWQLAIMNCCSAITTEGAT